MKKTNKEQKNNDNIKMNEQNLNENVKKIENRFNIKKEISIEEQNKINKKVFENILIANFIMLFLYFIELGALNIETSIFITDLKVFSIALIIFTVMLFEYSYRKENGNICIHGIECFFLATFILFSIYLYTLYFKNFNIIVSFVSYLFAIYYTGKSILIYIKIKKKYFANLSDIDEIIKK